MNYIGSKLKLSELIIETVLTVVGEDLSQKTFCDLFAGTGIVGRSFKQKVKKVIANDLEYYSYVLIRNYIGNHRKIKNRKHYIDLINNLEPVKGFIFMNYCMGGGNGRQYFSDENGKKIDAVRQYLENIKENSDLFFFLLASLLESADQVANTASVYGAYLKKMKKTALKDLVIKPAHFETTQNKHEVFNEDSNELIMKIEGDILYLDPPYNSRQYGANYHLLNTIAIYDEFVPQGKTGLRNYIKSKYCRKFTVLKEFEDLIKNAKFQYIFLSYNNEGLMSVSDVKKIMSRFGKYDIVEKYYQRFKADKTENRNHKANSTMEYLHILEKNG